MVPERQDHSPDHVPHPEVWPHGGKGYPLPLGAVRPGAGTTQPAAQLGSDLWSGRWVQGVSRARWGPTMDGGGLPASPLLGGAAPWNLGSPWLVLRCCGNASPPPRPSILKEISPGLSLEGLMLKLKLQYFSHLMRRVDSLPEQPLGRGSALPRLGAELELRRSGSSLGPSQ